MVIHGRNLILSIGGVAVAGAKSCDININADDIEISTASSSKWREFIAGRIDWTATCNHLLLSTSTLISKVNMTGKKVTISVGIRGTNDVISGSAIIRSWRTTGTVGNICQGAFGFRGSGPLT